MTGGAGFIGSHLVDLLITEGFDVVVVDNLSTGNPTNLNPRAKFENLDIRDQHSVARTVESAEYVFHTAALARIQPSFDDPITHNDVNVTGTLNCVMALAKNTRLKKFVVSSSSSCYGNTRILPTPETAPINCLSPYALQKFTAEQHSFILGRRWDIPVLSLRYFNVYGPRSFDVANSSNAYSSVVGIFHHQNTSNQPLTIVGDGTQTRDLIHVSDVAQANLSAALSDSSDEAFNVGSGVSTSIKHLAGMFDQTIVHMPERPGESQDTLADISKIRNATGWRPLIPLTDGLQSLGN